MQWIWSRNNTFSSKIAIQKQTWRAILDAAEQHMQRYMTHAIKAINEQINSADNASRAFIRLMKRAPFAKLRSDIAATIYRIEQTQLDNGSRKCFLSDIFCVKYATKSLYLISRVSCLSPFFSEGGPSVFFQLE